MTSPCSRKIVKIGGNKAGYIFRRQWLAAPMVRYLKFTLKKSNTFHHTISCTDELCNDLFNDSKPKNICFSKRYGGLLSWAFAGERIGHLIPGNWTKNQKFLENLKSVSGFRLIDLILAIKSYLPVWHSHCTRAIFVVLVWCSDKLAVYSMSTLLQFTPFSSADSNATKIASALFYCCSSLRNNNMATNLQGSLQVTI